MIPMKSNLLVLSLLRIYPLPEDASMATQLECYIFASHCFITTLSTFCGSLIFVCKYLTVYLEESLFALLQTAALFSVTYMQVYAQIHRSKFIAMVDKYPMIYKKYENDPEMLRPLLEANKRSEWITIFYYKYVIVSYAIGGFIALGVNILIVYKTYGTIQVEKIATSYQLSTFWDANTFLGRCVRIMCCENMALSFLVVNAAILTFFMAICEHHEAFSNQFKHLCSKVDVINTEKSVRDLVNFHLMVKDLFWETADAYSGIIWVIMVCSTMHTACSVYQMDLGLHHPSIIYFDLIMCITASLSTLFLYSFWGKMASTALSKMADHVYECNWFAIDNRLKKVLILVIGNAQKPATYHGFHVLELHLETFTKILKTVLSCYMMFKTLEKK